MSGRRLIAVLVVLGGGCGAAARAGEAARARRGRRAATQAASLAPRGAAGEALVTRVVDGDTAILDGLGRSRLIGIDTPEVHGRSACFGAEASRFTQRVLQGQRVRYEIGAEARDRYGRALVYVWLADGRLFNELLVAAASRGRWRSPPTCASRRASTRVHARPAWRGAGCGRTADLRAEIWARERDRCRQVG